MQNDQQLKDRVLAKIEECRELAKKAGHDMLGIPIFFDLKGKVGGQFCLRHHRKGVSLRFNMEALRNYTEHYLNTTVPHEYAHYVQFESIAKKLGIYRPKPHGNEWKTAMKILGAPANRCHSYKLTNVRAANSSRKTFKYKCECNEFDQSELLHNRMQANTGRYASYRRTCRACKTAIVYKGLYELGGNTYREIQPSFLEKLKKVG